MAGTKRVPGVGEGAIAILDADPKMVGGGGGGRDLLERGGEGGRGSRGGGEGVQGGGPPPVGMKIKASPWGGGGLVEIPTVHFCDGVLGRSCGWGVQLRVTEP